jgi:hypothetical protein
MEIALILTGSLKGMEMRSSGSTSDSRYERPLGPAPEPRIDERGCEADSFRHERPLVVMCESREPSAGAEGAAGAALRGLEPDAAPEVEPEPSF